MNSPLGLSIAQACELSGIGRTSVYAAIKRGDLVARKCGRRTVIIANDLATWLSSLPKLDTQGEPRV
jgi:excisionase family DNA binding protein